MLVSIVTLLKTQLTVSSLCLSLASLASFKSLISFWQIFENLLCVYSKVSGDWTAVITFGFVYLTVSDGDVSSCRWPGDVRSPSGLKHGEEEEVGRFEAAVEASGLV